MRSMSSLREEFAYLAGLIDGEGSILLTKSNKGMNPYPVISIANTDLQLLEWVKARFGGSISKKKANKENHSESYTWKITNRRALLISSVVSPYLKINKKRARAEHFTKILDATQRNGKYTQEQVEKRSRLVEEFYRL